MGVQVPPLAPAATLHFITNAVGTLLNPYLKRRLPSLIVASICTLLLGLVSVVTFAFVGPAVKILTQPRTLEPVSIISLFGDRPGLFISWIFENEATTTEQLWRIMPYCLVGAALVRALLALLQWFLWEQNSEKIARSLRADLVRFYLHLHPENRRDDSKEVDQELSAAIGNDVRMVREYIVHFYGGFPRELIQVILYLITMIFFSPMLSLFFILGIGPAAVLLSRIGKKLRKRSQTVLNDSSRMVEWLQQRLSGIETIKQYQTEELEIQKMRQHSNQLLKNFLRAARLKARTSPLLEFFASAAMALVLWYALGEIAKQKLSSSEFISFFALLAVLSQSASRIGRYFNSNKEGKAAVSRLERICAAMLAHQHEALKIDSDEQQVESLVLDNVSYRYKNAQEDALHSFSASFAKGKIYAIAGASGSGKSTLVKLVLGLWKVQSGRIVYNFKDQRNIGYLPQDIQLLPESFATNISYPLEAFDVQAMEAALAQVDLINLVETLPEGVHTRLGASGTGLSGGQAQRIKIARLFYFKFPLIIIDEGTSALDPEVEALILKALRVLADNGSSILLIAHRLSALHIADELIVLKKGRELLRGRPDQLLNEPNWQSYFESGDAIRDPQNESPIA